MLLYEIHKVITITIKGSVFMKLAQLKTLVKQGESENLEFKASTGSLSNGMQTVCAFLNSDHGGTIVFGVKDDGKIVGQEVTDKTRKEIAVELTKIEPSTRIDVKYVRIINGRSAIIFSVNPGEKAPYTYDGRPFVRMQSTTTRMSKEEYTYLHNINFPILWEKLTNNNCKVADLDKEKIKDVIREAVDAKRLPGSALKASVTAILEKLGLIVNEKITNAAVTLFGKNEQKQFMQCNVKLARFKGVTKSEFIDTKYIVGNAFNIYDETMKFLHFNLPVAARIESGKAARVETPAIPYSVLREALVNALVHRDYSNAGGSLAVAVYNDRVNISNTGSLPKGIVLKELSKDHPSILRNPLIAHIFYLCGKIEKWGRGTIDMIEVCKKSGNPQPVYEEIGGSFSVTFPLKEPIRLVITKQFAASSTLTALTSAKKIF